MENRMIKVLELVESLNNETFKLSTLLGVPEWFKPYYKEEL